MDKPIQHGNNTIAAPAGVRPMMPSGGAMPVAAAMSMTPKDIMGILRRHLWLIITLTVVGTAIGVVSWFLFNRYMPRYTAIAQIEVLPPMQQDPTTITEAQPQKDIYYQFRFTKAALMTQQNMLQELLRHETVRGTNWYKQFTEVDASGQIVAEADAFRKAIDNLRRKFQCDSPARLQLYRHFDAMCQCPGSQKNCRYCHHIIPQQPA